MQSITKNAMIIVLPYHKLHYGDCQWPTFALCLYEDCNVTYLGILFNTCKQNKDSNIERIQKCSSNRHRTNIERTSNGHRTDIERTSNGHRTDIERTSNRHRTDIKQTLNGHWMDIERTLNGHWTDIERTFNKHRTDMEQTLTRHWTDFKGTSYRHPSRSNSYSKAYLFYVLQNTLCSWSRKSEHFKAWE